MNFKSVKHIFNVFRPSFYRKIYSDIKKEYSAGSRGKSRCIIFALSSIFILDYMMFSHSIESPIWDIFPSIPALEDKKVIDIYIPSSDSKEIISEKREIDMNTRPESLVAKLFYYVVKGSIYENTATNVPVNILVKKIWLVKNQSGAGQNCYIDLFPVILGKNTPIISGSENMFREAIKKTIKANMPRVSRVLILEKGVPFRPLWEI